MSWVFLMIFVVDFQTNIRSIQQMTWFYIYLINKAAFCFEFFWSFFYITIHVKRIVMSQKIHVKFLSFWQSINQKIKKFMILHNQMCITSCFLFVSKLIFKLVIKFTTHASLFVYFLSINERFAFFDSKHVKSNFFNQCRKSRNSMWELISFDISNRMFNQLNCYNFAVRNLKNDE